MAINYNKFGDKEYTKKDGRILVSYGPRDRQMRAQKLFNESDTIRQLQNQVNDLLNKIENNNNKNLVNIDDEINKAVKEAIEEVKKENSKRIISLEDNLKKHESIEANLNKQIEDLKNNVTSLKVVIEAKDDIINFLKTQIDTKENLAINSKELMEYLRGNVNTSDVAMDKDRPKLKTEFIDPLDKSVVESLESHIDVKEEHINSDKEEKMDDKVKKLKSLLGK